MDISVLYSFILCHIKCDSWNGPVGLHSVKYHQFGTSSNYYSDIIMIFTDGQRGYIKDRL